MGSQLLITMRVNNNLLKQNRILEGKYGENDQYSWRECLEISAIPGSISNNNLDETVLKTFSETGITVDSKDVEACERLKQPAKPKKGYY